MIGVQLASLYYLMRDFGSAAKLCDDLIRLDPVFWPARWFGGMALEQQGRSDEANRYLAVRRGDVAAVSLAARRSRPSRGFERGIGYG